MSEVRIPCSLFDLEEMKILESYEYGDTMILTWLELTTKSRRMENRRFIWKVANGIELTDRILSHLFNIDIEICNKVFSTLNELGFIERNDTFIEVFRIWEGEQRNRNTPEYKKWRKDVFERDDYTCQICKVRGRVLNAHHIIAWSHSKKDRFNVSNGITLCEFCHKELHKRR